MVRPGFLLKAIGLNFLQLERKTKFQPCKTFAVGVA
jgi:hypothetical protein